MKHKVKTASDLKRLALSRGAAVEHSGGKFNTTRERVASGMPPTPPPPPRVDPPPPQSRPATDAHQEAFSIHLDMEPVAKAIGSGNEMVCKAIAEAVKEIHVPASGDKPSSWVFTVKRDTRGFIQSVEASPKQ